MNTMISFTPAQLITMIIAICGGIITLAGAMGVLGGWYHKAKAPENEQNTRIDNLETKVKAIEKHLEADKNELDMIEEGNRVTQRALLALLSHGIDGNHIEAMKKSEEELKKYLTEK